MPAAKLSTIRDTHTRVPRMHGLPKAIVGSMVIRLSNSCLSVLAILPIIEPPSQKRQYSINARRDTHVFNLDLFYLTSRQRNEYAVPGIPSSVIRIRYAKNLQELPSDFFCCRTQINCSKSNFMPLDHYGLVHHLTNGRMEQES